MQPPTKKCASHMPPPWVLATLPQILLTTKPSTRYIDRKLSISLQTWPPPPRAIARWWQCSPPKIATLPPLSLLAKTSWSPFSKIFPVSPAPLRNYAVIQDIKSQRQRQSQDGQKGTTIGHVGMHASTPVMTAQAPSPAIRKGPPETSGSAAPPKISPADKRR